MTHAPKISLLRRVFSRGDVITVFNRRDERRYGIVLAYLGWKQQDNPMYPPEVEVFEVLVGTNKLPCHPSPGDTCMHETTWDLFIISRLDF